MANEVLDGQMANVDGRKMVEVAIQRLDQISVGGRNDGMVPRPTMQGGVWLLRDGSDYVTLNSRLEFGDMFSVHCLVSMLSR